jgi:concanavalin A-like lectin/glucanase superfamily protein
MIKKENKKILERTLRKNRIILLIGIIIIILIPINSLSSPINTILNDDLVGYWSFDDSTNVGNDDSGNSNNGINHGASWISDGVNEGALDFERDNANYISFLSPVLNTPPYTICAWVKPESLPINDNWYIISNGAETSHSYGFVLYIKDNSTSDPQWVFSAKGIDMVGNGLSCPISSTEWTFLCGTWDGSTDSNSIKFYVDGVLIGAKPPVEKIVNGPERNLVIGQDSSGWGSDDSGHLIDGCIDEVRIYNRVLNQNEIQDLYYGIIDINQSIFDHGFPIRNTNDGNWGAAQSFSPFIKKLMKIDILIRKFGNPEFDLNVQLREGSPDGILLEEFVFLKEDVLNSWHYTTLAFDFLQINPEIEYFIVIPPSPYDVSNSYGYEWGLAFGNQYDDGSFWFTRDGGGLWRDLPTMYDFVFKTYGYD